MIELKNILNKPSRVRADDGTEFVASAVEYMGVIGIAAWKIGQKPINRGKHTMCSAETRDNWFLHLDLLKDTKENP